MDEGPQMTNVPTLDPSQQGLLTKLNQLTYNQLGQGVDPYPGHTTVGSAPIQSWYFDRIMNMMGGGDPLSQSMMGSLTSAMQPWDEEQATKFWTQAIQAPAMQNWEKNVVPEVMERFAAFDQGGGGMAMKALAESGKDLQTNLAGSLASTLMQDKNSAISQALQAAGLGQGWQQALAGMGAQAGQMQRGIMLDQVQEPYQKWLMTQPWANPWLKYMGLGLGTKAFDTLYQPGTSGGAMGMMGGIGNALGGMGSAMGAMSGSK